MKSQGKRSRGRILVEGRNLQSLKHTFGPQHEIYTQSLHACMQRKRNNSCMLQKHACLQIQARTSKQAKVRRVATVIEATQHESNDLHDAKKERKKK